MKKHIKLFEEFSYLNEQGGVGHMVATTRGATSNDFGLWDDDEEQEETKGPKKPIFKEVLSKGKLVAGYSLFINGKYEEAQKVFDSSLTGFRDAIKYLQETAMQKAKKTWTTSVDEKVGLLYIFRFDGTPPAVRNGNYPRLANIKDHVLVETVSTGRKIGQQTWSKTVNDIIKILDEEKNLKGPHPVKFVKTYTIS